MPKTVGIGLSRRERETLEILYRLGKATAAETLAELKDPITDSAMRSILRTMVEKGYATYTEEGKRYVYSPTQPRSTAAQAALQQVIHTFFHGSLTDAVKAFLANRDGEISEEELAEMDRLIQHARKAERP